MRNQLKTRYSDLKNDIVVSSANIQLTQKSIMIFSGVMLVLCALVLTLMTANGIWAADGTGTIFAAAETIGDQVYKWILGISSVLAGVALTIALLTYFFSSNGKSVEQAGGWIKRTIIAYVCILAMSTIIKTITSLMNDYKSETLVTE